MDKTNALSLTGGGMFDGGWTPVWLIKDEFTDTRAAGSVNGTAATPGPGTRAVVESGTATTTISTGELVINNGTGNTARWNYGAITRAVGRAAIVKISNVSNGAYQRVGFLSGDETIIGGRLGPSSFRINYNGTDIETGILYPGVICCIMRSSGGFLVGDNNTLLWVYTENSGNLTAGGTALNADSVAEFSALRVLALPAPFDTDDGIATDTLAGSVAAGTTFSHEANALVEATITTVPSADNIDIVFRQQDASNYWICRVATGGDISLQEVVAGTPTQRGVAAGVVSNGHRVVVIAEGTTIKIFSNNTLRITYSSASNGATATAGEVDALGTGGVVSNLKTWPRTLSGTAASILNKASG